MLFMKPVKNKRAKGRQRAMVLPKKNLSVMDAIRLEFDNCFCCEESRKLREGSLIQIGALKQWRYVCDHCGNEIWSNSDLAKKPI